MDPIQQEMNNILPHHANTNTNSPAARHTQINGSSSMNSVENIVTIEPRIERKFAMNDKKNLPCQLFLYQQSR